MCVIYVGHVKSCEHDDLIPWKQALGKGMEAWHWCVFKSHLLKHYKSDRFPFIYIYIYIPIYMYSHLLNI